MTTKRAKEALLLLHAFAAEVEMAFGSFGHLDWCVEIPASDARRLLARYERLRQKLKADARPPAPQS